MKAGGHDDAALWQRYVSAHESLLSALNESPSRCQNLLLMIRRGLNAPQQRAAALHFAQLLTDENKKLLFPDLVALASYVHGLTDAVIELIYSLPKDWVRSNIESVAEPILSDGTYEEYRMFLRIYTDLDTSMARELAARAIESEEPDIREAGEDWQTQARS